MSEEIVAKYMKELDNNEINNEENILVEVQQIIEQNPNIYTAYLLRGRLYARQKLYQEAENDFTTSLFFNSANDDGYLFRAQILQQMEKMIDAISDFSKAIEINKNKTIAYFQRGNVEKLLKGQLYHGMRQYKDAINDFTKAIDLDPKNATAYYNRGAVFVELDKFNDSIIDYTKAIELNPKYATAYNKRGKSFQSLRKIDYAIRDYTKAIQLDSKDETAYYNRVKLNDAIREFTKAIQLNPNYADAYYQRGVVLMQQDKLNDAIREYTTAIQLQPSHPLYLSSLGQYYLTHDQFDQAQKYILQAQNVLDNTDQQQLVQCYNLSLGNIKQIKKIIELLSKLKTQLQQIQTDVSQPRKQNTIAHEQEKQYQQFQNIIHDQLNSNLSDQEERMKNLEKIIKLLKEQDFFLNQRIVKLEQSDSHIIDNKLKFLREPQNNNKYLYYISFCPRILAYLETCVLVETSLIQMDNDKAIETKAEKLMDKINQGTKLVAPLSGGVPIVGSALEILFDLFDLGVEKYKENKLNEKISKIVSVIKCQVGGTQSQREKQFQLASFQSIDQITEQDLNISDLEYYDQVQKIIEIELKQISFAQNQYWQLGVYNCIIVLKYIEKESKSIIANENLTITDIILKGMQMRLKKNGGNKQVPIVAPGPSSCCQIF